MPRFRIHRLRENSRNQFRWAPHVSGPANVKPRDYELSGEVDAENEYAAWACLRNSEKPLAPGDILESESNQLRICKYVGFEEARWVIPEPAPAVASAHDIGGAAPVQS